MQTRNKTNAQGIDVSHWQGDIDWGKVAASGISFAFIKATQNKIDPKFLSNVKGAKAAGLLVGAYHYMDDSVTTVDKARAAAQDFYKAIQAAGGADVFELPFVLDYESNKQNLSQAALNANAKAFLEEIQRLTGVTSMLYTYPAFIGNFSGLSNYPLWIARYSNQAPVDASGWNRWDFWQYSDGQVGGMLPNGDRKVAGIAGPVDLNEFAGTVTELKTKYGKKMTAEREKPMETAVELEKRIAALEKKLNMSGMEPLPKWAEPAVIAGKQKGVEAITTSADKSIPELVALQMLYNIGLLDPDILAAIRKLKLSKGVST
ncbi:glycoside hydrolase family 25 protein [Paenibacillus sp.]|jgi:lysozyme|uniref:glycoside hydrolase family 25 protein n=1 Tax=Paenibacillus sp. TaxID=58172 RepID=UPI0028193780|nr:glycoside hydrolase family 25 protein [Paenibacillus sp.]MDR0268356.1 glycoside hydrolase family 25 protein [Paenibacillus sp.]